MPMTRQPPHGPSGRSPHTRHPRGDAGSTSTPCGSLQASGYTGLGLEARCVHVGCPAAHTGQPLTPASPPACCPLLRLWDPRGAEKSSHRSEINHHEMRLNGTTRGVTENGVSIHKKAPCPDVGHSSPTLLKTQIHHTGLTYLEQNTHRSSLLN